MRPLHQSEQKSVTTSESIHLGEAVGVEVGWAKPAAEYALPPGKALVMLTCDADMRSPLGVQWPTSGPFEARDMIAGVERYRSFYGDRLFGLLWGEGEDVYWLSYESDAKWLVVEIDDPGVERCEKVFFERGRVVHVGDEQAATDFLNAHSGRHPRIVRDDALAQWNKEHGPIAKGEP